MRERLKDIIDIANMVSECPKYPRHIKKTIITSDIIYALRFLRNPAYEFVGPSLGTAKRSTYSITIYRFLICLVDLMEVTGYDKDSVESWKW